jgi:hypothetical protein
VRTEASLRLAGAVSKVRLVDLGIGGAGVTLDGELPVGGTIDVLLNAPNRWDPLVFRARVAWCGQGRAGLAFEHRSERDAAALWELLDATSFGR